MPTGHRVHRHRRFIAQVVQRDWIGSPWVIGCEHDPVARFERRPQPVNVSAFMRDNAVFFSQQTFESSQLGEQALGPVPFDGRDKLVRLFDKNFLHGLNFTRIELFKLIVQRRIAKDSSNIKRRWTRRKPGFQIVICEVWLVAVKRRTLQGRRDTDLNFRRL